MAGHHRNRNEPESDFSFAVDELRRARLGQKQGAEALRVTGAPLKAVNENRGFDPYNTSGSFDRKNNWTRVGKR
jgi:hypothetical protein